MSAIAASSGWLHHWYWWTFPAGIALGVAVHFVIWHVIPPRAPLPRWLRFGTHRKGDGNERTC